MEEYETRKERKANSGKIKAKAKARKKTWKEGTKEEIMQRRKQSRAGGGIKKLRTKKEGHNRENETYETGRGKKRSERQNKGEK